VSIERTRPVYVESATVLFALPASNGYSALYTWQGQSLIATGSVMSQIFMSPQIMSHIRKAGGTASYDLELVNLYNQDYPDYSYPEATLTAYSPRAANTRLTYLIALRTLTGLLARRQVQAGAPPGDRIVIRVADNVGPVAESGSRPRSVFGLLLLAMV